jgi:16S rRNA A1518/A1519 N6-dimethyltransferase RsmA/KsgA/DIM1 with predicted DNA glycosylase/AP lyase activity
MDKFRKCLKEIGWDENVRAEVLEPCDFRDLFNALK